MDKKYSVVGKSEIRVDAVDKARGVAQYTDDLADPSSLIIRILHSTIANGRVLSIDAKEAEAMPGVVRVITCFDVPKIPFATAGHPYHLDAAERDAEDRLLLTDRVRYYGDDIAVVIAEDNLTAVRALRTIKVEYEEYPFVLDSLEAIKEGAPLVHDEVKNNILAQTRNGNGGNMEEALSAPDLVIMDRWYETSPVKHCHIENPICTAVMRGGKIVIRSATQSTEVVHRVTAQALGIPQGQVRIIKPYVGGGFGNKQDVLYEPLCAFCCTQVGGRPVKLELTREEDFVNTRTRHGIKFHVTSWLHPDATFAAAQVEVYANTGAYASHGHAITENICTAMAQIYNIPAYTSLATSVYTNLPTAGAMRGYGIPQATFCIESHIDDIARHFGLDPREVRMRNRIPVGRTSLLYKYVNYTDSLGQIIQRGADAIGYDEKREKYAHQTGPVRRGIGMSAAWYYSGVWPFHTESCSVRMVLNQDGSVQLQLGDVEIGQGADTVFSQMAAETLGVPFKDIHIESTQDTDLSPYGFGAYASRQTYVSGPAIVQTGNILKEKILAYAQEQTRITASQMEIRDGVIVNRTDGKKIISLGDLAFSAMYSTEHSVRFTAESMHQNKTNELSFSCCFAEVEVDIPLCKVKLLRLINVHDCGTLINPALAEAQVHGGQSMAIGYALSEQMLYDEKTGRMLNNNLLDYKLSTFMDHPHLEALFIENPAPSSPFGNKGLGEPPACSPAPAIRNAICQATGIEFPKIPITPHVLFEAFKKAGLV